MIALIFEKRYRALTKKDEVFVGTIGDTLDSVQYLRLKNTFNLSLLRLQKNDHGI